MEYALIICSILWVAGWIKELAYMNRRMDRHDIEYPNDGVKYAMVILLAVAWPYFYFYMKAD
jgi:hypothetical protein